MKNYIKDIIERAIKTFAQALLATLGASYTGLIGIDWIQALSIAGFAALLSVLTSIASANFGDPETAGIVTNTKIVTLPVPAPVAPVVSQSATSVNQNTEIK